jgi:hypothetical protein
MSDKNMSHVFNKMFQNPDNLGLKTPPFLKLQFRLNRRSSPPDFEPCIGTEDAPLSGWAQMMV